MFNNIDDLLMAKTNMSYSKYGFPVLHLLIRFLDFVLHVSYRIGIEKRTVRFLVF